MGLSVSSRRLVLLLAIVLGLLLVIVGGAALLEPILFRSNTAQTAASESSPPETLIYVVYVVATDAPTPTFAPTVPPANTAQPTGTPMPPTAPAVISGTRTRTPATAPGTIQATRTRTPTTAPGTIQATRTRTLTTAPGTMQATRTLTPATAPGTIQATSTLTPTTAPGTIQATSTRTPTTAPGTIQATSTRTPTTAPTNIPATSTPTVLSETYSTLPVLPPPIDRPAAQHADLNLSLRGYVSTAGLLALLDLDGATDPGAPQLPSLFSDNRARAIESLYRVHDWDWGCNCRAQPIADPEVTLIGLTATAGEALYVPNGGSDIGNGFRVLVLYADAERITLKYTREDSIVFGYALHLEGINVDPNLLALYQQTNSAGRASLPALRARQQFGTARTTEVKVAIRDTGAFMEPRSRKDWWR